MPPPSTTEPVRVYPAAMPETCNGGCRAQQASLIISITSFLAQLPAMPLPSAVQQ